MSKKSGIEFEAFKSILEGELPEGVSIEDKAAWVKIEGPHGNDGPRMYVAKQVRVREVHLSAFGKGFVGTIPPKDLNGRVQAYLDLEDPNALSHFRMLLEMLPTLPKTEKPARAKIAPLKKREETASSRLSKGTVDNSHLPKADNSEEAKAKRLALIAKVAKEKGVEVSPLANA